MLWVLLGFFNQHPAFFRKSPAAQLRLLGHSMCYKRNQMRRLVSFLAIVSHSNGKLLPEAALMVIRRATNFCCDVFLKPEFAGARHWKILWVRLRNIRTYRSASPGQFLTDISVVFRGSVQQHLWIILSQPGRCSYVSFSRGCETFYTRLQIKSY